MKGSKLSVLFQLILILLVKPTFQRRFVQSACNKNDRDSSENSLSTYPHRLKRSTGQIAAFGKEFTATLSVVVATVQRWLQGLSPASILATTVFSGSIPVFCNNGNTSASSLRLLDFSYNEFTGEIHRRIGSCSKLEEFRAGFNNLYGPIPDEIYSIVTLEHISLPVNRLAGPIGDGVGQLSKLRILELYSNQLNGSIPEDIGKLASLEKLLLHINNFTGFMPSSLMKCTNLSTLNLRVNSLVGNLSGFDFSALQRLATLDLGNNFTGETPSSLYTCKSLTAIRLAANRLKGQVLPEILDLKSLSFLSISNNTLTNITGALNILKTSKTLTNLVLSKNFMNEAMPEDESIIGPDGFQNIQVLGLGGCLLSGRVPTWLAKLKMLQVSDLSVNLLTGPIPGWLGSLPGLFYLDLSRNPISGEFQKELCGLPALTSGVSDQVNRSYLELPVFVMPNNATNQQYNGLSNLAPAIHLGNNNLSGNIPEEIGQLKFLHVLELNNNNFSGSIPDQMPSLTNLEKLDLSRNHLTDEIPASLKGLHFLLYFSVAYNDLQGIVPSGGQFDTFPSSNFDGNRGLCGCPALQCACSKPRPQDQQPATTQGISRKNVVKLIIGIYLGTGFIVLANERGDFAIEPFRNTMSDIPSNDMRNIKATLRGEVYSFGVVMLELLTGKTSGGFQAKYGKRVGPVEFKIQQMNSQGKEDQAFDPLLRGKDFDDEMLQVLDLACICEHQNVLLRPTIGEVVERLNNVGINEPTVLL
ncbi:Tyrosine-sulfated glycopeptide receptor 1 [Morus notabilis]|uniref:Tyrosine-sulfated glycopeptide receptor 1 n=1 Tax=Morus notabilis TaxID=981085 RepID=W9R1Y2_9ROSA|nr:Tyrosine-sulfated glycopeptide receptor 1 [Morus notabilis]